MPFDVSRVREEFPALSLSDNDKPRVYFDNPGGTQVPRAVIDRFRHCLIETNANLGGHFRTTVAMDAVMEEARRAMADFLGAQSPEEIIFGQNMTSLTFHMSRCIASLLKPGDEIVVTQMDHDANISPWLLVARDRNCAVRWLPFDPETFEFDADSLGDIVGPRTRVVALNYASNVLGTINDVATLIGRIRALAPAAIVYVDAVQYAPHGLIDVRKLDCDMLVCSPYKFFGPHQGVLWGRREVLDRLDSYKVRPAGDVLPYRFETGTLGHEGVAGILGTVEYFTWLGDTMGDPVPVEGDNARRTSIKAAWRVLGEYETGLTRRLIDGLSAMPEVRILGISNPNAMYKRVPTVAITHKRLKPIEIARAFADRNVFVWNGHNFAVETARRLNLLETGGALRTGLAHYNTESEVDFALGVLDDL